MAAVFDEMAAIHALLILHVKDSELRVISCVTPDGRLITGSRTLAALHLVAELYIMSEHASDCHVNPSDLLADRRFSISFDGDIVVRKTCAYVDLGGIVKGFAVDRVIEMLCISAVEHVVVNAGDGPRHHGAWPMSVQVRDLQNAARVVTSVLFNNAALASSTAGGFGAIAGSASRICDAHGRLLPPLTGAMAQTSTCMLADALTKAVPVTGDVAHPLLRRYGGAAAVYS